jgi:hypothetical protein
MNNQEVDIEEGTIEFWINKGKVRFGDKKFVPLIQLNPRNGGIYINKNEDDELEFTHIYIGRGTTKIVSDVSSLDPDIPHMFAFTWSVENSEIIMYIDGKIVAREVINYKH